MTRMRQFLEISHKSRNKSSALRSDRRGKTAFVQQVVEGKKLCSNFKEPLQTLLRESAKRDLDENYFKHGITALWFSANLFFLFVVSLRHAIFPFIFINETFLHQSPRIFFVSKNVLLCLDATYAISFSDKKPLL